MPPKIGEMNKRLTLIPQSRVSDGAGGWTVEQGQPVTVWAKMRQPTARELIKYQALETEIDTIIEIRYLEGIKKGSTATLSEKGKIRRFVIDAALDEKMTYEWLEIAARELF